MMPLRTTVAAFMLALAGLPCRAASDVAWDRIANVKSVAVQIGEIQAQAGVERAFRFVSDCYKTHSLASAYSKAFEGCIAQDYMLSRTLKQIYAKVPKEALARIGAPSPEQIDRSFSDRVSRAMTQYHRPAGEAQVLARIVEQHGMPVFLKTVFPDGEPSSPNSSKQKQ